MMDQEVLRAGDLSQRAQAQLSVINIWLEYYRKGVACGEFREE
jgi:hypothetical protein